MTAPLRIVRTNAEGVTQSIVRETPSEVVTQMDATLRVYRQGYVAGFVECMKRNGVWDQLRPEQQTDALARYRQIATDLLDRKGA